MNKLKLRRAIFDRHPHSYLGWNDKFSLFSHFKKKKKKHWPVESGVVMAYECLIEQTSTRRSGRPTDRGAVRPLQPPGGALLWSIKQFNGVWAKWREWTQSLFQRAWPLCSRCSAANFSLPRLCFFTNKHWKGVSRDVPLVGSNQHKGKWRLDLLRFNELMLPWDEVVRGWTILS